MYESFLLVILFFFLIFNGWATVGNSIGVRSSIIEKYIKLTNFQYYIKTIDSSLMERRFDVTFV